MLVHWVKLLGEEPPEENFKGRVHAMVSAMKPLACILCLFPFILGFPQIRPSPSHTNNVLVLIQPALAGPDVNPLNYWQPQWIWWPPSPVSGTGSRLLSMATGENWRGDLADVEFDSAESGKSWRARDFPNLTSRGHFYLRRRLLGDIRTALLVGDSGSASPNALRLALNEDSAIVRPTRISSSAWPDRRLMVMEASGWDQVAEIEHATTGRVLVVEYPPPQNVSWSRYWLKGRGWTIHGTELTSGPETAVVAMQSNLPVPGLIRATDVIPLCMSPNRFIPVDVSLRNWPGANRFFELYRTAGALLNGLWITAVAGMVIWGVVLVSNERSANVLPVLLAGALLSPAVVDVAGLLEKCFGIDDWPIWMGLASFVMTLLAMSMVAYVKRRWIRLHPLTPVCAIGLIAICSVDPIWSFLSPVFAGRSGFVSYTGIAAMLVYLTGIVASLQSYGRKAIWLGRSACLVLPAVGVLTRAWWSVDLGAMLFVPAAACIVGEGILQWPMVLAFAVWPSSLLAIAVGGFAWAPMGLISSSHDRNAVNLAQYVEFVSSPSFAIFLLLAGGISLFGYRFFFHQIRMLFKLDRRRQALPNAAVSAAAFGLLHPAFLPACLVVAAGALMALLFDAVQTM